MIHWVWTAVSTYLLHSEHGAGYAFWSSGPGPGLGQITLLVGLVSWWLHHRCDTSKCFRKGRYRTADGHHHLCRRCHPDLPDHRLSRDEIIARHEAHRPGRIRDRETISHTTEGGDW